MLGDGAPPVAAQYRAVAEIEDIGLTARSDQRQGVPRRQRTHRLPDVRDTPADRSPSGRYCFDLVTGVSSPKATQREWIGLAVLTLACLVYAMDLTVLNLAIPRLSADL